MGKASRRARQQERRQSTGAGPAPFVARPFEDLPGETDLVAMREILPSATAMLRLRGDAPALTAASGSGVPETVNLVTILPVGWPGLHRGDGELFVGLQSGASTGDPSRDVANVVLALLGTQPGTPCPSVAPATATTPRLQDIVEDVAPITVHEGFDFWVAPGTDMDEAAEASLQQANESIIPTVKLAGADSAYWCRVGDRTHLRWVLPHEENAATDALARLHAGGGDSLGEATRLLGAFRACGLLVPVWDLDPALEADAYEDAVAALAGRFAEALAADEPLDATQRRARSGLLSRQLTLR